LYKGKNIKIRGVARHPAGEQRVNYFMA